MQSVDHSRGFNYILAPLLPGPQPVDRFNVELYLTLITITTTMFICGLSTGAVGWVANDAGRNLFARR